MDVFRLVQVSGARRLAGAVGAAAMFTASALLSLPIPAASADPCPDVEVVFARGSGEPPQILERLKVHGIEIPPSIFQEVVDVNI